MSRVAASALLLAGLAACGGGQTFSLSGADNDPAALRLALARRAPPPAGPAAPVAYLALAGGGLQAWDLDTGLPRWKVDARPESRVVQAGALVVAREGAALVARDAGSGAPAWSWPLPEGLSLIGLAGDEARAYALISDRRRLWRLVALDAGGRELWQSEAQGALGTPAAAGGLVYLPFLSQWLIILDARTGERLARLRQEDEAVSWVRAGGDGVSYGDRAALILDEGAAAGRKAPGRSVEPRLPSFARLRLARDAFDPATVAYSALDRTRLLWRLEPGPRFAGDTVVLLAARYLIAFDAVSGRARWARILEADAVSAVDTGAAIALASQDGAVLALDRASGRVISRRQADGPLAGATLVVDGWAGEGARAGGGEAPPPVERALAAIALDRDVRFLPVRVGAVAALADLPGAEPTRALVDIVTAQAAPPEIERAAGGALVARRDPEAGPVLVEALALHTDQVSGREARGVGLLARALTGLDPAPPGAAAALLAHLEDPATPSAVAAEVARALALLGETESLPRLGSLLLLHRCDPRHLEVTEAVAGTLAAVGGAAERVLLGYVAADPRTAAPLRARVQKLLAGDDGR